MFHQHTFWTEFVKYLYRTYPVIAPTVERGSKPFQVRSKFGVGGHAYFAPYAGAKRVTTSQGTHPHEIRVDLTLVRSSLHRLYDQFKTDKIALQNALRIQSGDQLVFIPKTKLRKGIQVPKTSELRLCVAAPADLDSPAGQELGREWLARYLDTFHRVLAPVVRTGI